MKDYVNAVIAELFAGLEARFAGRPIVTMLLHMLEPVAEGLVDSILANLAAKGVALPQKS
ncbi:MAG: hypothetical protein ACJ8F7_12200 [Gemmataceae bacterium]